MVFRIKGFMYGLNFSWKKDVKPSASNAAEPGGIGFPQAL